MQINIRNKIRSFIRRNLTFFCFSYSWQLNQIIVHQNDSQYLSYLNDHLENGLIKRAEGYFDETIDVGNGQQYLIYWVSFGDFRRTKIINGQNPIAKGFGVCIFDFVYFFVEPKPFAQQKIKFRIKQLSKSQDWFYRELMKSTYSKLFQSTESQIDEESSFGQEIRNGEESFTKSPQQSNYNRIFFEHHSFSQDRQPDQSCLSFINDHESQQV